MWQGHDNKQTHFEKMKKLTEKQLEQLSNPTSRVDLWWKENGWKFWYYPWTTILACVAGAAVFVRLSLNSIGKRIDEYNEPKVHQDTHTPEYWRESTNHVYYWHHTNANVQ